MDKKEKIVAGIAIGATILTIAQCSYYITKSYTPSEFVKISKKTVETVSPAKIDDVTHYSNGDIDFKMSFPDEVEEGYSKTKTRFK